MLYDDVIDDKDYVGFKRVTEERELRKYNRRQEPYTCCMHDAADDPSSILVVCKLVFQLLTANTVLDTERQHSLLPTCLLGLLLTQNN